MSNFFSSSDTIFLLPNKILVFDRVMNYSVDCSWFWFPSFSTKMICGHEKLSHFCSFILNIKQAIETEMRQESIKGWLVSLKQRLLIVLGTASQGRSVKG